MRFDFKVISQHTGDFWKAFYIELRISYSPLSLSKQKWF